MLSNCDEKGHLTVDNMSKFERRGFYKLMKRMEVGEIIMSQTDKSSKNAVSTAESYIQQGQVHV